MSPLRVGSDPNRLEMDVDGHTVFAEVRRDGGALLVDHVEAPPVLRGTGAAGRFMEALAAHARSTGEMVTPLCGYAAAWFKSHPEWSDIVG